MGTVTCPLIRNNGTAQKLNTKKGTAPNGGDVMAVPKTNSHARIANTFFI
jgi:hypothetical protein